MRPWVDLTLPLADHFRWSVKREHRADFTRGDAFQVTWLGFSVHGFTHIDSPRHMVPGGPTTSAFDLDDLVGEAEIVDLSHVPANARIDADTLARAAPSLAAGRRLLLMARWDERASIHEPAFWTTAPWLDRSACEWLLGRRPRSIGFDFPQDYPIRGLLDGRTAPIAEFVSHDVLLRHGVPMIEYLCNLGAVGAPRCDLVVLPLKVLDADGAPVRAIARAVA